MQKEAIVTYSGLAWLIAVGSGLDDWVYWHFFTITVNYSSSHIELRLLSDECSVKNLGLISESLEFTNEFLFITATRPECKSPCQTVNCPSVCCHGNLFLATFYLATTSSLLFVAAGAVAQQWTSVLAPLFQAFSRHVTELFRHLPVWTEKTAENLSQDIKCPCPNLSRKLYRLSQLTGCLEIY
jgi:hypothetical protein